MTPLPRGSESWFDKLKPYQKAHLAFLVREHEEMKAAEVWLSARGPQAVKKQEPLVSHSVFIAELRKILEGNEDYGELVKILSQPDITKAEFTVRIAETFAEKFGVPVTLLMPPTSTVLSAIATIGIENWLALQEGGSPE